MNALTIEVSGSYRDQGRQHGEALAPVIQEIMDEVLTKDTWDAAKVDSLLLSIEGNFRRSAPGVLEEIDGIAEGSGAAYEDILAYNALADIWMVHKFCSTAAWADTPDGIIIGKTNDIGRDHEKYHHPFRRRSGDGLAAVWATWPGTVWSNCFVNEAGLAHGGASLGMDIRNEAGIPSNCMYRVIMDQCETVEAMVELCGRVPVMHHPSHNVFADKTGALVATELTPEGARICQGPGATHVAVTNHFCAGPDEGKDNAELRLVENSRRRLANIERLSESLDHTVEGMQSLVRDHAASGQVCQHGNEDMWSSTAYVAIPSQRRFLM
ncbi:MAG TPA: C45 family peptidase, partial [Armatimonadota bacterium]|nr:C45 family peptidase [Armatimonadota bacterium]